MPASHRLSRYALALITSMVAAKAGEASPPHEAIQVSSGGVSLGAYQSGYLLGHDWLRSPGRASTPGLRPLSKSVQVGASAGAINTLAGVDQFFKRTVSDTIDLMASSYRHWLSIGIGELANFQCPPEDGNCSSRDSTSNNGASLFFREAIARRLDMVISNLLDTTGKRDDTAWIGFALTRARPVPIPLFKSDTSVKTQSQQVEIGLSLALRRSVWTLCEQPSLPGKAPHWFTATVEHPGHRLHCTIDTGAIRSILTDLVLASSAFPLAFSTFKAKSMRDEHGDTPIFSDGGIFSNQPFQIGWKLARLAYPIDTSGSRQDRLACPDSGDGRMFDGFRDGLETLMPCRALVATDSVVTDSVDSACLALRGRLDSLLDGQASMARARVKLAHQGCTDALALAEERTSSLHMEFSKLLKLRSAVGESLSIDTFVTVFIEPENFNSAYRNDQSRLEESPDSPGATWTRLAGPLFNSARSQELARFATTDRGWNHYSQFGEVNHTRMVPAASHVMAFASFLAKDLREFDMALGLADACLDAAEQQRRHAWESVGGGPCRDLRKAIQSGQKPGGAKNEADTVLAYFDAILEHYQDPTDDDPPTYIPFDKIRSKRIAVDDPNSRSNIRRRRMGTTVADTVEAPPAEATDKAKAMLAAVLAGQGTTLADRNFGSLRLALRVDASTGTVDKEITKNLDDIYDRALDYIRSNRRAATSFTTKARYSAERQLAQTLLPPPLLGTSGRDWGVGAHFFFDGPPMPFVDWVPNMLSGPRLAFGVRCLPWRLFPGATGEKYGRHELATTDAFGSLGLFGGATRLELGGTFAYRPPTLDSIFVSSRIATRAYVGGVLLDKLSVGVRLHPLRSDRPNEAFLGFIWLL